MLGGAALSLALSLIPCRSGIVLLEFGSPGVPHGVQLSGGHQLILLTPSP